MCCGVLSEVCIVERRTLMLPQLGQLRIMCLSSWQRGSPNQLKCYFPPNYRRFQVSLAKFCSVERRYQYAGCDRALGVGAAQAFLSVLVVRRQEREIRGDVPNECGDSIR